MAYLSSYQRTHYPRPLTNNTVLITGAASGIGRSLCRRLSQQGASLALIDRDGGALDDLARELEMARVRFRIAVADVRDRPGLGQAVDALVRELGPIDMLVASAGVCGISLVDDLKVEQVEEILKVNFLGVVYTIDCVLPSMLLRKSGHIVGIASLAAICGLPLEEAYNASKAALAIYLEGLRPALRRRGIAVTTVFPGFVHTPLLDAVMVSMGIPRLFGSIETATATAKITQAILQRRRVCCFPRTTTLLVHGARLLPAAALDWIRDRIAGLIPVANARSPLGVGADHGARVR
jgi:short-subunit dehydrogenase